MKIEYLPPENNDQEALRQAIKNAEKQETIGCLLIALFAMVALFVFLAMLPILLVILGYIIIATLIFIAYKMWLEAPLLNFIQKHRHRSK